MRWYIYWNRTSTWVFSCKLAAYFQNTFSIRSSLFRKLFFPAAIRNHFRLEDNNDKYNKEIFSLIKFVIFLGARIFFFRWGGRGEKGEGGAENSFLRWAYKIFSFQTKSFFALKIRIFFWLEILFVCLKVLKRTIMWEGWWFKHSVS